MRIFSRAFGGTNGVNSAGRSFKNNVKAGFSLILTLLRNGTIAIARYFVQIDKIVAVCVEEDTMLRVTSVVLKNKIDLPACPNFTVGSAGSGNHRPIILNTLNGRITFFVWNPAAGIGSAGFIWPPASGPTRLAERIPVSVAENNR